MTIIAVQAQPSANITINPRCQANGIIDVDYAYKIYSEDGYTNYIAILEAGKCERQFRGTVNRITDLDVAIRDDINTEMETRTIAFHPDPFGDLDVDGRGFYTIP